MKSTAVAFFTGRQGPYSDISHARIAAVPLARSSQCSQPLGRNRRDTSVKYVRSDAGTLRSLVASRKRPLTGLLDKCRCRDVYPIS